MKNSLTLLLLFIGAVCNAQLYYEQKRLTQFDTFINRPSVEWAAYANDSIRFTNPNLSEILVKRMEKGEIKSASPFSYGSPSLDTIVCTNRSDNEKMFDPGLPGDIYDSLGNIVNPGLPVKIASKIDSITYNLTWVTQVLYIENGSLKSYIPFVSTAFSFRTQGGQLIDIARYFNSCFNFKYSSKNSVNNKIIFLKQTKRKMVIDSILKTNILKQLYVRNLLETIWPYALKGKCPVYSVETGEKIDPGKLDNFILSNDSVRISIYDSLGNEIAAKYRNEHPILFYIPTIEIIQNWYYDLKNNLVFCKIPYIFLYARRELTAKEENEPSPVLKIVFN